MKQSNKKLEELLHAPMQPLKDLHGMETNQAYLEHRAFEYTKRVLAVHSKHPVLGIPKTEADRKDFELAASAFGYKCFEIAKKGRGRPSKWKGLEGFKICATVFYHRHLLGKNPHAVCDFLSNAGVYPLEDRYGKRNIEVQSLYEKWQRVISKLPYIQFIENVIETIGFDSWVECSEELIYLEDGSLLSDRDDSLSAP